MLKFLECVCITVLTLSIKNCTYFHNCMCIETTTKTIFIPSLITKQSIIQTKTFSFFICKMFENKVLNNKFSCVD